MLGRNFQTLGLENQRGSTIPLSCSGPVVRMQYLQADCAHCQKFNSG